MFGQGSLKGNLLRLPFSPELFCLLMRPMPCQDLVEKVVVLRRAVQQTKQSGPAPVGVLLAEKMSQYANLLASQGSLSTAISYLPDNTNQVGKQTPPY